MTLSRNLSLFAETVDSSGKASLTTGVTGTLPAANGGTGVNNGSNTITLANTLTTAGNFPQTLTASAATNVTLPPGTSSNYVMSTATQMANNPITGTPSSSNYLRGDGTWAAVANTAASYTRTTVTATASQTVFTVAYTSPYLAVYLNGVLILPTTDYTATNGTSVTLTTGAAAGDILDFLAYATGTIIQLPIDLATSVTGTLPPSSGGTGTTGTPSNGQLLIGNGSTYSTASLTAGTGISVTNGSGSITLANTGVTSNVAGTGISVSGATGAVTISIGQAVATSSNVQFNSLGVGTAGSGTTGEIRATNNITAYYSDIRLKTKVGDITDPLGKVRQIETMLYHANETAVELGYDASIIEVGLSAQSVQAVQPEAVAPAPIDDKYLTVRYERLVPLLIEAIKELEAKIAKLEAK